MTYKWGTPRPQTTEQPVEKSQPRVVIDEVPECYRGTADLQRQVENNIAKTLGHFDPETVGIVVQRTASDPNATPEERSGLVATGLQRHAVAILRERLNELKGGSKHAG